MKATDLRIGNLVFHEDKGIIRVTANDIVELSISKIGLLAPIKLSEEILLKCGFEKGSNIIGDCYYIEHDFGASDFVLNITKTNNFNVYELDLQIKYLHQLQNLYWCLCGEELTVNL